MDGKRHVGKGSRRRRTIVGGALAVALAAVLVGSAVAVGGGGSRTDARAVVKVRSTGLGRVLVDGRGRTLYLFEPDEYGRSTCYGACATAWPPLLTTGKPRAGSGARAGLLGTTKRRGGGIQVTYDGYPLYVFVRDTRPGQTAGQGVDGFGGEWYVLDPLGRKIENGRHGGDPAVVRVRRTALGAVLADGRGRTLYLFEADTGSRSACYGACAAAWPPLLTTGKPRAGAGAKAALLGTTKRRDGRLQVTYAGHPLYAFVRDTVAGQALGQGIDGFGAEWYVLGASGNKVDRRGGGGADDTPPPTTTTPDDGGGGYGYGY